MTEQPNPKDDAKKNGVGAIVQGFITKGRRRAVSAIAAAKAYLAREDPTVLGQEDEARLYASEVMSAAMNTLPVAEKAGLMDRVAMAYGILGTDTDGVAARLMQSAKEHGGIADPDDVISSMANSSRRAFERTARGLSGLIGAGVFGGLEEEVRSTTSPAELIKVAAAGIAEAYQRYMGRQLQTNPARA
ncbi:MAG TPA: hypothetical protein VJG90_00785 [Candidatus Nanoarchaeia archaeon]|nr:hypothetical protein [Candidatus Nanoarchaeia archaeon]